MAKKKKSNPSVDQDQDLAIKKAEYNVLCSLKVLIQSGFARNIIENSVEGVMLEIMSQVVSVEVDNPNFLTPAGKRTSIYSKLQSLGYLTRAIAYQNVINLLRRVPKSRKIHVAISNRIKELLPKITATSAVLPVG